MTIRDELFENAISSIQLGFEDYVASKKDSRRILSAVRNVHAGILLFLMSAIKSHTPNQSDILIRKQFTLEIKNDQVIPVAINKKTINRDEIIERLKIVNKPLDSESIILLEKLGKIRNDVEHHFTADPATKIQEYIFDAFWLIKKLRSLYSNLTDNDFFGEFIYSELMKDDESYRRQVELCYEKWAKLNLNAIEKRMPEKIFDLASEQFAPEMTKCLNKIYKNETEDRKIEYKCIIEFLSDIECNKCKSNFIEPNELSQDLWPQLYCNSCRNILDFKDVIEEHLEKFFAYEIAKAGSKGGIFALERCPKCNLGCYLNFTNDDKCLFCGNTEEKPYDEDFIYELQMRNVQLYSGYW